MSLDQRLKDSGFRRGLLADWGYATLNGHGVPEQDTDSELPDTLDPTPLEDTEVPFQPTSPVSPSSSVAMHTETVTAEIRQGGPVVDVPTRDLTAHHNIKLKMGTDRPDRNYELSDSNPLHRTVSHRFFRGCYHSANLQ